MASSAEYRDFILDQLSQAQELRFRPMMGEYLLYYRGKLIGGIYDDRLLVKPCEGAVRLCPDAPRELPYEGAKEMILVDRVDDPAFLFELFETLAQELPDPKGGRKKT